MEKETLIGIAVLVLVGAVMYLSVRPMPAKAPIALPATALPAGGYVEHAQYYDITADYATSTPLTDPANTAAVTLMKNFVGNTINQFKTDGNFANLTPQDIKTLGFDQGRKEKLQILYLMASSPRTVSYIFTTYMDTLGAHGNTFFHTFVFDTDPPTSSGQAGKSLALADLFLPGVNYLDTLSTISRAKLPAVIGESADATFIKNGTAPEDKNFANFFFDNRDFVILFDPYAVAPYSSGPETLRIPVAELSSLLKPAYR